MQNPIRLLLVAGAIGLMFACDSGADAASTEVLDQEALVEGEAEAPVENEIEEAQAGGDNLLEEGGSEPDGLVAQPGAVVGAMTTCPVSGDVFNVAEESHHRDHEGAHYYFCSADCGSRFEEDPEGILAGSTVPSDVVEIGPDGTQFDPAVEKSQIPSGAWICDMGTVHYAAHSAGSCVICGMHLTQL